MNGKDDTPMRGSVMVVGGGIGGMQAALDLANSGFKVHMVQKEPSMGGTMVMLDKTFPTGDCSMCMISPKMVEVGRHLNIEIHTMAEVSSIEGEPGDFKATVKFAPRYVTDDCTGCSMCEQKCPKKVDSEFDQLLGKRKAIYATFPQAMPNTRTIDAENCIYLTNGKCGSCKKVCPVDAINFDDMGHEIEINIGAVILSPGLALYDGRLRAELGLGRWDNVVSSIQFERILSASGPFQGEIKRLSDDKHPKKVAWIQCVGSRDRHNGNPWCSSVCCMYSTKQSIVAKEHDQNIEPTIFYMEMRAFGKDFDKYVERAKNEYGVRYQRAMVSSIKEDAATGDLNLRYSKEDGELIDETFDMVVLSVGFEPHKDAVEFAKIFGIETNEYNFAKTSNLNPVETSRKGIFVTGIYQGPKDIPETVIQGSAVAGGAMALLSEARGTEAVTKELPPETEVNQEEPRIGVFVCHCGKNIAGTVNIKEVMEEVKDLPNVEYVAETLYACAQDNQDIIRDTVKEKKLNRVVVAACTPRTHEALFQDTIRDAGVNKYLFDLADIREQCSWCHSDDKVSATKKASKITKMAIAKARLLEPISQESVGVTPNAIVIGGGIAGMTTALSIAEQGFDVHLIEKDQELGGIAKNVRYTLQGDQAKAFIEQRIKVVESHPGITVHKGVEVDGTTGFVGNFSTILTDNTAIEHGAIVIATGGVEYEPTEYGYADSDKVITQRELEDKLSAETPKDSESYVMIQCVGSREEPAQYCSRVCCQDAIKNAIAIKEKNPAADVTIVYRDIRTYGLREDYYEKARKLGVLFVRYEVDNKPKVSKAGDAMSVEAWDFMLNRNIMIDADYVVLSTGLRPHPSTVKVSKMYKLTLNADGYFLEAHVKLRPVDFPSEGVYVTGLAHAPKNLDETLSQSMAAAGRAAVILSKERLVVSGVIAKHKKELCMSCLSCLRVCPFGSPYIDEDGTVSHNEAKCMGCGICAGICPAKAFQVNSFSDNQILAMVEAAAELEEGGELG
jgi:heterodisulfide reductase subunit A